MFLLGRSVTLKARRDAYSPDTIIDDGNPTRPHYQGSHTTLEVSDAHALITGRPVTA